MIWEKFNKEIVAKFPILKALDSKNKIKAKLTPIRNKPKCSPKVGVRKFFSLIIQDKPEIAILKNE